MLICKRAGFICRSLSVQIPNSQKSIIEVNSTCNTWRSWTRPCNVRRSGFMISRCRRSHGGVTSAACIGRGPRPAQQWSRWAGRHPTPIKPDLLTPHCQVHMYYDRCTRDLHISHWRNVYQHTCECSDRIPQLGVHVMGFAPGCLYVIYFGMRTATRWTTRPWTRQYYIL